jgi:16S rRNA processing protein RimM
VRIRTGARRGPRRTRPSHRRLRLGLPCITPAGEPLGEVVAVENFGAGDVIEIAKPDGKTFMVPMRSEAVPDWNSERLVVDEGFVS